MIGRQSLLVRDAETLGMKEGSVVLLLEGSDESIVSARKLLGDKMKEPPEKEATDLYNKIKEDESKADQGMGFLFG